MIICMNIFLGFLAFVTLFGMIGDENEDSRRNCANGFMATIFAIIILNALPLF